MNEKRLKRLLEVARAIYSPNETSRCWHCTFLIKNGKIYSIGFNNGLKTHTKNLKFNYFSTNGTDLRNEVGIHSELSAVIKGGRESYPGFTFVNVRLGRNKETLYSAPCQGCNSLLKQVNYKKVFYSVENDRFECL